MMSPTVETPAIQEENYDSYHLNPVRKNSDSGSSESSASSKDTESCSNSETEQYRTRIGDRNSNNRVRFLEPESEKIKKRDANNNRGPRRPSGRIPPFRPILIGNHPTLESLRDDESSSGSVSTRNLSSGVEYPLLPRHGDLGTSGSEHTAADEQRPAFPHDASVSLPTSTTTLDYLLKRHNRNSLASQGGSGADFDFTRVGKNSVSHLYNGLPSLTRIKERRVRSDLDFTSGRRSSENASGHGFGLNGDMTVNNPDMPPEDARLAMNGDESIEGTPPQTGDNASTKKRRMALHAPGHVGHQFFHVEPCLYTHRMFERAAKIFQVLKSDETDTAEAKANRRRMGLNSLDKEKIPDMEFKDPHEQIKTFELTFATLKYQHLFHEILENAGFFAEFLNLRDHYSLVSIILYDLQSRKFQRRTPFADEELDEQCTEIEEAILSRKTRLLSHIAKERIKRNAPSIEYLLPEQVRNKDETKSKTPVYGWVNQIKTTMADILASLQEEGFEELDPGPEISEQTTRCFRQDPHCCDLLTFPPFLNMFLKESQWVSNGHLVLQDKSSCLGPQSVQHLLGLDQDVIHVNVGTGMTTGHIASLLRKNSAHSHVFGIGVEDGERAKKALKNLEFLGVKNAKIIQDNFLGVDPEDTRYKNVRVIMLTADCSKSAITSPVQFIVSEGEDMQILGELSKADSNMERVGELTQKHEKLISHALKFPRVRAVVYTTRSRFKAENEQAVTRALDTTNKSASGRKMPFRVTPPVLPFSGDEIGTEDSVIEGRYVRFQPSDKSNGCFVAVISREPEDPKEAARNAIARARSKGMLGKSKTDLLAPEANGDQNGIEELDGADGTECSLSRHSATPARKSGRRKSPSSAGVKGASSAPHVKSTSAGGKLKLVGSQRISSGASAIGARLYQQGVISKMEKMKIKPHKPEHVKVVKHPAPFSNQG